MSPRKGKIKSQKFEIRSILKVKNIDLILNNLVGVEYNI